MGVRLASALASGFLVCIVTDIRTNPPNLAIDTPIWLDKLSGPYAGTLAAYAAQDSACHSQVVEYVILLIDFPPILRCFRQGLTDWTIV